MAYKLATDGVKWLPIDEHTPRGVKLLLISDKYGVAQIGIHTSFSGFFTHWCPLPTFGSQV